MFQPWRRFLGSGFPGSHQNPTGARVATEHLTRSESDVWVRWSSANCVQRKQDLASTKPMVSHVSKGALALK